MCRKLTRLAPLLLALAAAGLTGCTKSVMIPIEQVRIPEQTTVTQLGLKTGETVTFDSTGGRYVPRGDIITGTIEDGSRQAVKLKEVDRVSFMIGDDSTGYSLKSEEFKRQNKGRYRDTIKGSIAAVYTRDDKVEFDSRHGQIDSLNLAVVGTSKGGENVAVPFTEINALKIERARHAMGSLALGWVVFFILGAYGMAQADW